MSTEPLTWDELRAEVKQLAQQIEPIPDIIVGIVRGGIIPARLLSTELCVPTMYCLTVKKIGTERIVTSTITENLARRHILLVEDVLETGESLMVARRYLVGRRALVKTAALYRLEGSVKPDDHLSDVVEIPKFPWE